MEAPQGAGVPGAQYQSPCVPLTEVPLTEKRKYSTRVSSVALTRVRIFDWPIRWPSFGYSMKRAGGFVSGVAFGMPIAFPVRRVLSCACVSPATAQSRLQPSNCKVRGFMRDQFPRKEACDQSGRKPSSGRIEPASKGKRSGHRGVQYACQAYRQALKSAGLVASMSRRGNCYDNAAMEAFWSTLKREAMVQSPTWSKDQVRRELFEHIEGTYNRSRLHSSLGYQSPVDFEQNNN